MTREYYIGNVIYPDPTAWEAIGKLRRYKSDVATAITNIRHELEQLNRRTKSKDISKRERLQLRTPLVEALRAINQTHMHRKEEINNENTRR